MFIHSFKNTFKILLRNKSLIFWSLIFPIVLGVFFKLAFGNLSTSNQFNTIPVGVNEELLKDDSFKKFIDNMEKENYFEVHISKDDSIVNDKDISCYIKSEDEIITKTSGANQSIVESIMNSYKQNKEMIAKVLSKNPNIDISKILEVDDHIKNISKTNMDSVNVYFYVLLGMQVLYGYSWGLEVIYQYEANLSVAAKRNSIAPVNKKISLIASLLVAWIINCLIVLFTMFILNKVFKIDFGGEILPLVGLILVGGLTGVSFGTFLGVSNKASMEVKGGLGIGITMLLCFLSGMMIDRMKLIIEENIPFLNRINPVTLFTDAIYSLYYYNSMDRYFNNLIYLIFITLILMILTFFFLIRGKQYDSL